MDPYLEDVDTYEHGEDFDFGDDPSSDLAVRQQHGPIRSRLHSRGQRTQKGAKVLQSTKRTKKEVDSLTTQTGRASALPDDFVCGFYPDANFDYVKRDVKSFADNPENSLGGGFPVTLGTSYPSGGDAHGHKSLRSMKCSANGCSWMVKYEWTTDAGWVLRQYLPHRNSPPCPLPTENHHNHALLESQVQVRAGRGAARGIPPELDFTCQVMANAFSTASDILKVVDKYANDNKIDVTGCGYDYIFDRYCRVNAGNRELDLGELGEILEERKVAEGLGSEIWMRGVSTERIFWEARDAKSEWARAGVHNVLLFDPTASTNRYAFKLCCFVTISSTGKTIVLAVCLIRCEDEESFEWCFRCFAKYFRVPPRVFITDGDGNIERAFDIMKGNGLWVGCLHHLCVFHISKNVYKHVRPVFGNNVSGFTSVQDKFWKIAKNSDVGSILQFDNEWDDLIRLVTDEVHDSEEDQVTRVIHWIKVELYNKRHKWAARYVSQHPTCGMLSSQRAEVTQSKLKRGLSANTRVVDLLYHIDDKNENSASRSKVFEVRLHTKNTSDSSHSLNVIRLLQQVLTPYAFSLVLDQEKQSTHYWSTSCSDPRETHESDDEGHDAPTYHPLEVDDEGVLHGLLPAAGEPQHAVIRHPTAPQQVDVALEYDDDGCVINFAEATETSPMSSRRTTPTWCSCMFFICMGGLPCRHMIHLLMTLQIQAYPTNNILQRWHAMTAYQVDVAVSRMLATQIPSLLTSGAPSIRLLRTPREDQYHALFSEFRLSTDIVLGNEDKFASMLMALKDMRTTFLEASHSVPLPTHDTHAHHNQDVPEGASFTASDRPDGFKEWRGDERNLRQVLGLTYQLATPLWVVTPTLVTCLEEHLLRKQVVVKWDGMGKQGWNMGYVTQVWCDNEQPPPAERVSTPGASVRLPRTTSDEDSDDSSEEGNTEVMDERMPYSLAQINATVYYSTDARTVHHMLSADTMVSWGTGKKGSWGLVQEKGLSNVPSGEAPGPPISRPAVGRPHVSRLKPHGGPTSGKAGKVFRPGARKSKRH